MIDVNTKLLGLIGYPLGHSISPLLHNYSLQQEKLNYVYLAFPIKKKQLEEAIEGFKAIRFRGLNVTIPYKEAVIPFLDEIDPIAEKAGAVNTIVNEDGLLKGYNTDIPGLNRMIKEDANFDLKGKKAMVLGAGGAARATGIALLEEGIKEIYLLNRTDVKAETLALEWKKYYPETAVKVDRLDPDIYREYINSIDVIIDTTPVGMSPNIDMAPLIESEYLNNNMLVVDLVYNPPETGLLKAARERGADYINGMGMLLYQGIESFKLWTNHDISISDWYKCLEKHNH